MGFRILKKSKKEKSKVGDGKQQGASKKKKAIKNSKETTTTRKGEVESQVPLYNPSSSSRSSRVIQDATITNHVAHEASIEVRNASDSSSSLTEVSLEESQQDVIDSLEEEQIMSTTAKASSQHRRNRHEGEEDASIDLVAKPLAGEDQKQKDLEEWNQTKLPLDEVVLQTELECTDLSTFVDTFLSDDASYSIEKYQQDMIGDKDIEYSKWKSGTTSIQSRSINFVHPLKNKVGPSQAKTSRQQQLTICGTTKGLCLRNTTRVQGVPGADCFRGEDKWILEEVVDVSNQSSSSSTTKRRIQMTVSYRLVFEKRCMVQKLIQKNYRKETKDWYEGYATFIKESLAKVEADKQQQRQQQASEKEMHDVTHQEDGQMIRRMIQKSDSTSDDTAATIQSSCTGGSFDHNNNNEEAEFQKDFQIACLTSQVEELKSLNENQAKRIDELEQQLRLSQRQQQQQRQPQQQRHYEKKLFTGHYIKQLQQHQHDKKLFTGHYLKQLQSTLDEHGRAVQ
mmetsp:Transcript_103969/g.144696  ORF Transcript_103969/g.144696 Transcript_103969/m.144696 type:complete len:510 (+) Transcript_103969:17-1546(+)